MMEYAILAAAVAIAVLSLQSKDLLRAVIIGAGIEGLALAVMYQRLLASDVALTQAIVSSTVLPALFVIVVYKTQRWEE